VLALDAAVLPSRAKNLQFNDVPELFEIKEHSSEWNANCRKFRDCLQDIERVAFLIHMRVGVLVAIPNAREQNHKEQDDEHWLHVQADCGDAYRLR